MSDRRRRQEFPLLREGETVECIETGKRYRVGRVTVCSASLHEVYRAPREVSITRPDGTVETFMASQGGSVVQVSSRACMKHLEPLAGE